MSPKILPSRQSVDSCTLHLQSWKPFSPNSSSKTLDSDSYKPSLAKRPCLSDRTTSFPLSIDAIDMSKLSLFDEDNEKPPSSSAYRKDRYRWMARKRRRRGSRSVSGRSSTGRCCSIGATATCSDFMVAAGATDSSGELFGHGNGCGEANWSSDVSDARNSRRERNVTGERENPGSGLGIDSQVSESGYGSEPGYRGDGEFGYEDEIDEEEEDARFLLWGERFGDLKMELVGENTFAEQKTHCRGRRKKNELKTYHSIR
ncbi:hypothetical protein V2J09_016113 [Rumex salicifolius]